MIYCYGLGQRQDEHKDGPEMTPDPDRKPTRSEMRQGGMVATAVLVFIALFTLVFVWIA